MLDPSRTLVMACATVIEEMQPLMPPGMHSQVLDFGLHVFPDKLRSTLQEAVNAVDAGIDTILLGYGMCSQAVIGLSSPHARLVAPRVDDCIAIFLGSRSAYSAQCQAEPGTYYLTKGWIEVGDTPFSDYDRSVARFGEERAKYILHAMLKNYTRLALINTGQYELEKYRDYTRRTAERFGLRFEEIEGSNDLVQRMLAGEWDSGAEDGGSAGGGGDFIVVPAGQAIRYDHFFPPEP